jgi:hypothetical protein
MVKPIKPSEVVNLKETVIPEKVIDCVNKLIAKNFSGGYATLLLKEVRKEIAKAMDCKISEIDENWLNFEDIYRKSGWKVEYDQPGYCESYEASYTFKGKS